MNAREKITTNTPDRKGENAVAKPRTAEPSLSNDSPIGQILHLQRTIGNQAVQKLIKSGVIQTKLKIGQPNDKYEQETDGLADQVTRMPEQVAQRQTACPSGMFACEKEKENIQTKSLSDRSQGPLASVEASIQSLQGTGHPLVGATRSFLEPRFGYDFSRVRIHVDNRAADIAHAINAQAFTHGQNIYFGSAHYQPHTEAGRNLLAHELTHVVQQNAQRAEGFLQRCPDAATDAIYDTKAAAIKAHAEYGRLPNDATVLGSKATADKIITDAKPRANCIYYIDKLKLVFDTEVKEPSAIGAGFREWTADAKVAEEKRMKDPKQAAKENLEKSTASAAIGGMVKRPGKFGGGKYSIDARDPNNIIVSVKILLTKTGSGTDADVNTIKFMKDAIEKAASTRGYIVAIDFVTTADEDTFKVNVDPDTWMVATNWSGGNPTMFAHELHHMLAFELDRYDYIKAHAENKKMAIPNRVHWFGEELKKPAGYNDPTSLMSNAARPSDNDVCTVAGLIVADCVAAREKVNKAFKDITAAYYTPEERILNCIMKYSATDPSTMMAVLRDIFRMLFGLPEVTNIVKRLNDKSDTLGKVFQKLTSDQQRELLRIISP